MSRDEEKGERRCEKGRGEERDEEKEERRGEERSVEKRRGEKKEERADLELEKTQQEKYMKCLNRRRSNSSSSLNFYNQNRKERDIKEG